MGWQDAPPVADTSTAQETQASGGKQAWESAPVYDPDKPVSVIGKKFESKPPPEAKIPKEKRTPVEPQKPPIGLMDRLGKIGETGLESGVIGAFTPEITTGLGYGMMAFPPTAPYAPAVIGAGRAMRAGSVATRVPMAIESGMAGIGGETAKQTADIFDAGEAVKFGAELAGQASGSSITRMLGWGFGKMVGLDKTTINGVINRLSSTAEDAGVITENQRERAKQVANDIKGKASEDDINKLWEIFYKGSQDIKAQGKQAFSEAERESQRLLALAEKSGKAEDWQKAIPQLQKNVGDAKELSDIGTALRDPIVKNFQSALGKRSADYKALEVERDKVLSQKESVGDFIENTEPYKALVKELNEVLKPKGRAATETDPGVLKAFQDLKSAITPQTQVLTPAQAKEWEGKGVAIFKGSNPQTGEEVLYRKVPPSFGAIDTVRRRLGDSAFGKEAEGYAALKGNLAQDWYHKLSKMQESFAGQAQKDLQNSYKEHSSWLDKYKAQMGKKATALDRFDETKFATDPKALPDAFFQSKQSIKDLLELTGDKALVTRSASDYASRSLGSTVKEAQAFKQKNSELLKEIPELGTKVDNYIKQLQRGELSVSRGESRKKLFGEKSKSILEKAGADLSATEAEAKKLLNDQFPVDRVKTLLLSGSPEEWSRVLPLIAKDPQGKEIFAKALSASLGQEVSGLVVTKPSTIGSIFEDKIAPALKASQLIDDKKIGILKSQLENLYSSPKTAQAKLSGIQRLLTTAIIPAQAGGLTSSATDKLFGFNQTGF